MGTLRSLSVSWGGGITGTIPTELGNLSLLEQLWIFGNQIRGTVPTELGALSLLKTLEVEGNKMEGTMPADICALNLTVLGADCADVTVSGMSGTPFEDLQCRWRSQFRFFFFFNCDE